MEYNDQRSPEQKSYEDYYLAEIDRAYTSIVSKLTEMSAGSFTVNELHMIQNYSDYRENVLTIAANKDISVERYQQAVNEAETYKVDNGL